MVFRRCRAAYSHCTSPAMYGMSVEASIGESVQHLLLAVVIPGPPSFDAMLHEATNTLETLWGENGEARGVGM